MDPGVCLQQPIDNGWNAFIYVLSGSSAFGDGLQAIESGAHYILTLPGGDDTDGIKVMAGEK
jgi:hypothetical protein